MSRHQGSGNPALVGKWTVSKAGATSWDMPLIKIFGWAVDLRGPRSTHLQRIT